MVLFTASFLFCVTSLIFSKAFDEELQILILRNSFKKK